MMNVPSAVLKYVTLLVYFLLIQGMEEMEFTILIAPMYCTICVVINFSICNYPKHPMYCILITI